MHSALFVARFATAEEDWRTFLNKTESKLATYPNVLRLAENVWLVDFQKSPASLAWLVSAADVAKVPYGILPFEHAPEWLPVGFDPKTILGQNAKT